MKYREHDKKLPEKEKHTRLRIGYSWTIIHAVLFYAILALRLIANKRNVK